MINRPANYILLFIILLLILSELSSSQTKSYDSILNMVKNKCVVIPQEDDYSFCFKNGKFQKHIEVYARDVIEYSNIIEPIIVTHFNSDSSEYAVVPIDHWMGGTGTFYYFLLFVVKDTCIKQLDCSWMSDTSGHGRFESIRVNGDTVLVEVDDYPHLTNRFLFRDSKLIKLDDIITNKDNR
jgi:hypothetical protein